MTYFIDRPANEQIIIKKAYDFEIWAIFNVCTARNPYFDIIKSWADGDIIWEALNDAVEMYYD